MTRLAARLAAGSLLAATLAGCIGAGVNDGTTEVHVYNRAPDKIELEVVPIGVEDPTTSPMYKKVTLEAGSNQRLYLPPAHYSFVAVQDDWERPLRRRIDYQVHAALTLQIFHRARMDFEEQPDTQPIFQGDINH